MDTTYFILPFSTGMTFPRTIPFTQTKFCLTCTALTFFLGFLHLMVLFLVKSKKHPTTLVSCHQYADSSGILLFFISVLLFSFSMAPTTLGLNIIAFVSCAAALQSLTSALGVLATNSWHINLLIWEGKVLLALYTFDTVLCLILFILFFRLLYVFDPCRPLMESLPTASYGTAEQEVNSPVHLWNTRSTVLQINIPDFKEFQSNE